MQSEPFSGWIASLSNGAEAYEMPMPEGERSAWQQLITLIKQIDVRVTMLRLVRGGITVSAMPTKTCDGYYQAYEATISSRSTETKLRQGIGSVVGDKVYITWINDFGNVWQDVRELEDCRIHTTLRD